MKALAPWHAAERAAQTPLLAARDRAVPRAYHLEAKAEVAAACAADAAAAAREEKARAATAATNHARNVKSRAKKTKAAGGQAVMATPGRGTTTVQRGHSGATVAEAKCAVPGASTVEEAKVTGPGKPNATSVVTETVVQSTAVAETAVEAEAAGDAEADLAPRGLSPWGSKDYTWQPVVQTKAPEPRKLFFLDGPFAPCLATVPEEAALATHILCEPAGPAPSPAASTQGGPNNGPNGDSWRHSRLIGDTDSKRLAGYLEDPA